MRKLKRNIIQILLGAAGITTTSISYAKLTSLDAPRNLNSPSEKSKVAIIVDCKRLLELESKITITEDQWNEGLVLN